MSEAELGSDAAGVDGLLQRLATAAQAGDAAGYAALFDPQGAFMPPNQPAVIGQTAIEAWLREYMSRYDVQIEEFAVEDRRIGPTVAFMRYRTAGRFVPRAGGEPVPMNHKYLETYAKDAGGTWRIVTHMWSSNDSRPSVFA